MPRKKPEFTAKQRMSRINDLDLLRLRRVVEGGIEEWYRLMRLTTTG